MNLSTRAFVGTGNATVSFRACPSRPGGGARRVLVRAAGPGPHRPRASPEGALNDPALALLDPAGRQIANGANDDWESAGATAVERGLRPGGRVSLCRAGSRDAALVIDLLPGNYTIQVSGVGGTTGTALVEAVRSFARRPSRRSA
jgi:hypothetical protein